MKEETHAMIRKCEIQPELILEHHEAIGGESRKEVETLFNRLIIISTKRAVLEGKEAELKGHLKEYDEALGRDTLRRFLGTLSNVYKEQPGILAIFEEFQ